MPCFQNNLAELILGNKSALSFVLLKPYVCSRGQRKRFIYELNAINVTKIFRIFIPP